MYHSITDEPDAHGSAYHMTHTSPAVFRWHMAYLAENGYRSMTQSEVAVLLERGAPLPEQTIVITFDDGFRNFRTAACPIMAEHGFTATMFLPTGFIKSRRVAFKGTECLTWEEVIELRGKGFEFGSHTVNHPRLVELPWAEVVREIRNSKAELEDHLGGQVRAFAYPFAFPQAARLFTQRLRDLLGETGYSSCATTEVGRVKPGDDPYRLKRLPVNAADDLALFQAKLEGDYDWIAGPQAVTKRLKQLRRPRPNGGGSGSARQPLWLNGN